MGADLTNVMLAFRAENVRSFRDLVALDLRSTRLSEKAIVRTVASGEAGRFETLLAAAAIYGANASGKTTLLRAMAEMRNHVLHSFRSGTPGSPIPYHPFAFHKETVAASSGLPSKYEVELILDNVRTQYSFALDADRIHTETLVRFPKGRAVKVFERDGDTIEHGTVYRAKGRLVNPLMRSNALFVSTGASAGYAPVLSIHGWFARNFIFAESINRAARIARTAELIDDAKHRERVRSLIRAADIGISDIEQHAIPQELRNRLRNMVLALEGIDDDGESLDINIPEFGFQLVHEHVGVRAAFNFGDESYGTQVWMGLIGMVVDALDTGAVLLADELDASLHPLLVVEVVRLFQNPETNPRCAQLVFNTHDTSLLGNSVDERVLGRDQIWFTEKRNDGSTHLFPLSDSVPRVQENVERRYLRGMYGGGPIVSSGDFAAALAEPALSNGR